jgi:hypothetical protein
MWSVGAEANVRVEYLALYQNRGAALLAPLIIWQI